MTAPIVPGLNDTEIPQLLKTAKEAGAITANYVLLRPPMTVEPVFMGWLTRVRPDQAEKVLGRLQEARGGKLNSAVWGERMVGRGMMAEQIANLFRVFRHKYGLNAKMPAYNCDLFQAPIPQSRQLRLF